MKQDFDTLVKKIFREVKEVHQHLISNFTTNRSGFEDDLLPEKKKQIGRDFPGASNYEGSAEGSGNEESIFADLNSMFDLSSLGARVLIESNSSVS